MQFFQAHTVLICVLVCSDSVMPVTWNSLLCSGAPQMARPMVRLNLFACMAQWCSTHAVSGGAYSLECGTFTKLTPFNLSWHFCSCLVSSALTVDLTHSFSGEDVLPTAGITVDNFLSCWFYTEYCSQATASCLLPQRLWGPGSNTSVSSLNISILLNEYTVLCLTAKAIVLFLLYTKNIWALI